ncbi:hypothetical protein F5146DRAFT_1181062, partial [Armillaria mellea]
MKHEILLLLKWNLAVTTALRLLVISTHRRVGHVPTTGFNILLVTSLFSLPKAAHWNHLKLRNSSFHVSPMLWKPTKRPTSSQGFSI